LQVLVVLVNLILLVQRHFNKFSPRVFVFPISSVHCSSFEVDCKCLQRQCKNVDDCTVDFVCLWV